MLHISTNDHSHNSTSGPSSAEPYTEVRILWMLTRFLPVIACTPSAWKWSKPSPYLAYFPSPLNPNWNNLDVHNYCWLSLHFHNLGKTKPLPGKHPDQNGKLSPNSTSPVVPTYTFLSISIFTKDNEKILMFLG